jgi:hypothetical protein
MMPNASMGIEAIAMIKIHSNFKNAINRIKKIPIVNIEIAGDINIRMAIKRAAVDDINAG